MNVTQRKRFVSCELIALAAGQPRAFAEMSERQYRDRIQWIAGEILASGRHIVMLTGASAAGKTTSAHKLAGAIQSLGRRSVVLSLDDFYAGRGAIPRTLTAATTMKVCSRWTCRCCAAAWQNCISEVSARRRSSISKSSSPTGCRPLTAGMGLSSSKDFMR